jgi:hypothetical protein
VSGRCVAQLGDFSAVRVPGGMLGAGWMWGTLRLGFRGCVRAVLGCSVGAGGDVGAAGGTGELLSWALAAHWGQPLRLSPLSGDPGPASDSDCTRLFCANSRPFCLCDSNFFLLSGMHNLLRENRAPGWTRPPCESHYGLAVCLSVCLSEPRLCVQGLTSPRPTKCIQLWGG